jgi:four helix bundle protein
MPIYSHYYDLPAWQEAGRLYRRVLTLLLRSDLPLTWGYRNQLDRAALSVSNNISEGFERVTMRELLAFLAIARGSAAEVRSMTTVVQPVPAFAPILNDLQEIAALADSCMKQLSAWMSSLEKLPFKGSRHLDPQTRQLRESDRKAREFRVNFLKGLKPTHPLFNSTEAKEARGEIQSE